MKWSYLFLLILLPGLVWSTEIVVNPKIEREFPIHGMMPTYNDVQLEANWKSPPITDSIHCPVFDSVDYGGEFSSPQNYSNADHIVRRLGMYDVPYIFFETGDNWTNDCLTSYWDDWFEYWPWEYATSTAPEDTLDTGRICASADTFGNIHVVWHGPLPTGVYEIWYRKKTGGTWGPVHLISADEGVEDGFPVVTADGDGNPWVVWNHGGIQFEEDLYARHSTDGGETWEPIENITNFGGLMFGSWILASIDCDLATGDVHVVCNTDVSSPKDNWMDIFYVHYDASSGTWDPVEVVAEAVVGRHPLACAQVVVDSDNVPHVVYQENGADEGGAGGLTGWAHCGPAGQPYYTYKPQGSSWRRPRAIFNLNHHTGEATGYPDLGIDENNYLYFVYTQPCFADTSDGSVAFFYGFDWASFNVYYSVKAPDSPEWTPREMVSRVRDPNADSACIYPQTNKNVPSDGPDITWSQLVGQASPATICYNHETPGLPPAGDVAVEWIWPNSETWGDIQVGDTIYPKAVFRCVSWEKGRTDYFMDTRFEFWWCTDSLMWDDRRVVPDIAPGEVSDTIECGFGIIIEDQSVIDSLRLVIYTVKANDTDPSNDTLMAGCGVGVQEHVQPKSNKLYLLQNRPNPFVQSTTINFSIPADGRVTLEIFDAAGRLVKELVNERLPSGLHSFIWDGTDDTQRHVTSGIYFYRLKTSGECLSRKMLLLK